MSLLNPNQPPDLGVKPGDDVPAFPVTTTLVIMEEQVAGESGDKVWVRVPQYPRLLHPVHGDACLRDLRRVHKSRKFRLTPVPDEDIPF